MAASVQVLCPNGRRQNVKINPNTKLLQILEEVCHRQGFIPPENYILVQGKKELDLSLAVRFSSLPNNAKLELAKATTARVEQDVTIALQLDSGQRLQCSFKPNTTLWDILQQLEHQHSDYTNVLCNVDMRSIPASHPVCIFMREEVVGIKALQEMTLKKLGLTSGNAIIRLLHRPVDDSVIQEIELKLEKEKQKQAKLEEVARMKSDLHLAESEERKSDLTSVVLSEETELKSNTSLDTDSTVQSRETANLHPEPMETIETEASLNLSSVSDSSSAMQRQIHSKKNAKSYGHDAHSSAADTADKNVKLASGTDFVEEEFSDMSPQEQAIARRMVARYLPQAPTDPLEPVSFADFKFPESTRGMDLSGQDSHNQSEENLPPCERETVIYRTDEAHSSGMSTAESSLPEDFFEVTQSDIKILYRDLQTAVQKLEDQPLMTKAMKRAQTEALYNQYEKVVIRIQFPEKLTLQGVFRPKEPVSALYSFVKEHLQKPDLSFYLYTTPPKVVLKDKKSTLSANRLAPAVIVYLGSDIQQDHYLSDTKRQMLKPRLEAESVVNKILQPSLSESHTNTHGKSSHSATRMQASSSSQGALPSGSQMPKWLRLGKK